MTEEQGLRKEKPEIGLRDVVDPYPMFSVIPIALGVTTAFFAMKGPWTEYLPEGILAIITLWLGLWGLHFRDLLMGGLRDTDERIQENMFYILTVTAFWLGVILSWLSTWKLLPLVITGAGLGLSYNLELLDGMLHDVDRLGLYTFGYAWCFVPAFGGAILVGNPSVGPLIMALGLSATWMGGLLFFKACNPVAHRKNPLVDNPKKTWKEDKARLKTFNGVVMLEVGLFLLMIAVIIGP